MVESYHVERAGDGARTQHFRRIACCDVQARLARPGRRGLAGLDPHRRPAKGPNER
ncbi:MAG TPA: hypothetical protein VMW93_01285 [bacterium]|nr:hypothetical protein [bacterium]